MKLIIDIPNTVYEAIQAVKNIDGSNEGTLENVLINAVENGKPISDDATNLDITEQIWGSEVAIDLYNDLSMGRDWWDSPYRKGGAE